MACNCSQRCFSNSMFSVALVMFLLALVFSILVYVQVQPVCKLDDIFEDLEDNDLFNAGSNGDDDVIDVMKKGTVVCNYLFVIMSFTGSGVLLSIAALIAYGTCDFTAGAKMVGLL